MNQVTICCLGHGGAFADASVGNTAYLVKYRDHKILVDCGSTVPLVLKEFGVDPGSLTAVLVTHLHQDHCGGLEQLLYHRHYINKAPPIPLVMGPDTQADWEACVRACKNDLGRHYVCSRLDLTTGGSYSETSLAPGVHVEAFRVNHGGDIPEMSCYSFVLVLDKHQLFFSGDRIWRHEGDADVFDAMQEADMVFHELELFPTPSGAHTHISDLDDSVVMIAKKFWWGHHGATIHREDLPPLNLARKGHIWQLDHEGPKLTHRE